MHYSDKLLKEISYIANLDIDKISDYILNKNFLKRIIHFDNNRKKKFKAIFDYLLQAASVPILVNPSCLQTTPASVSSHIWSHTVPHSLLRQISTRPSV